MTAYRPILIAAMAATTLMASAQGVDRILVTQAGLVPEAAFSAPAPGRGTPVDPGTVRADFAGIPGLGSGGNPFPAGGNPFFQDFFHVMPLYVVRERQTPEFRLRDVYTHEGLEALSFHEHPGLHLGNFHDLNKNEALVLFTDEERLDNIQEFRDTARAFEAGGDLAEANAIRTATARAFILEASVPCEGNDLSDAPQTRGGARLTNLEQLRLPWLTTRF